MNTAPAHKTSSDVKVLLKNRIAAIHTRKLAALIDADMTSLAIQDLLA